MKKNVGNRTEGKKPYTEPTLTVDGRASELTAVRKTSAKDGGSAKKSYTKPTLTIYGTIHDLTKQVGINGPSDGGTLVFIKTKI
jgi:hypothetical protein